MHCLLSLQLNKVLQGTQGVFFNTQKISYACGVFWPLGRTNCRPCDTPWKSIIFVASDLRNGGVYGGGKGLSEAISKIEVGTLILSMVLGSEVRQGAAIRKAIDFQPDAIVWWYWCCTSSKDPKTSRFEHHHHWMARHRISGWKSWSGLFTNITTDPLDVAEIRCFIVYC